VTLSVALAVLAFTLRVEEIQGTWTTSCHKPSTAGYVCDCGSTVSGEYWTAPDSWICTIKNGAGAIKGFGLRAFSLGCSTHAVATPRECGTLDSVDGSITPFDTGVAYRTSVTTAASTVDNRYITIDGTDTTQFDTCSKDTTHGESSETVTVDHDSGAQCKQNLKDSPTTGQLGAWSRITENRLKTINVMKNLQVKYRVVRMEVCDYLHKCKSTSGCSSESTNDLGTIEREGSVCASKKAIVSCQMCNFENGCDGAAGAGTWATCDTEKAAAAVQSG